MYTWCFVIIWTARHLYQFQFHCCSVCLGSTHIKPLCNPIIILVNQSLCSAFNVCQSFRWCGFAMLWVYNTLCYWSPGIFMSQLREFSLVISFSYSKSACTEFLFRFRFSQSEYTPGFVEQSLIKFHPADHIICSTTMLCVDKESYCLSPKYQPPITDSNLLGM